jgi:hypothetical protein
MKFSFLFSIFSLSPKNNNIENGAYPLCKKCVYFQPHPLDILFNNRLGKCTKYGKREVVSGNIVYDYATVCRLSNYKCGVTGKDFEEMPDLLTLINETMQYFSENSSKGKYIHEKISSICRNCTCDNSIVKNQETTESLEKNEEQYTKENNTVNCTSGEENCSTEFCNECISEDCKKKSTKIVDKVSNATKP